jgi:hypothetical protein
MTALSCTGCAVTPCSAISQASCWSLDDRRGAALPLEDVVEHVGEDHIQKVFHKGSNGNHSGQEVAAHRYAIFSHRHVATQFGGVGESCFLSKKVAKWYKILKDC